MTQRLPSAAQFHNARPFLHFASERALIVLYSQGATRERLKAVAIDDLKSAVEALGYELVERLPGIPTETAKQIISACETVPDGARDA